MKYTHIFFDCGAAMKAFHILWNNPQNFPKIILHLGDFHVMQAFFGATGSYITGSGFEDVIYQLGLCQPGSMSSLLNGKRYNQSWLIHGSMAEAICRLFQKAFVDSLPDRLVEAEHCDLPTLLRDDATRKYLEEYLTRFEKGLKGDDGKTAQYWLQYVDMVDTLHWLHYAIQTNNFEERTYCWRKMLPIFFFFDKTHYARYGTYYTKQLENLEITHPGAKEELQKFGISVCRNNYGIGQAIDLAGEQTYMKSSKTIGGITHFQTKKSALLKWVLNCPFQSKFVEALKDSAGLEKSLNSPRKCLRPKEILKSDEIVINIMKVLKTQFLDPFDGNLRGDRLYNLVSGMPVSCEIDKSLLSLKEIGENSLKEFEIRTMETFDTSPSFFHKISRKKHLTFSSAELKPKFKKSDRKVEIVIERDILGSLLAFSNETNSVVDMRKALCYPYVHSQHHYQLQMELVEKTPRVYYLRLHYLI